ncbi:hypothetical protein, partial [Burkholderia contaminans]|uniref:hypothetical protein n=1 Tax=Burkholderia contaminans TaxID=488447 RepID=UPI0011D0306A
MISNFWRIALRILAISPVVLMECANGEAMNLKGQAMQFSYTTNGGADGSINSYGNNEVSVSGDVLSVQIGDSAGNKNVHGIGAYKLKLQGENLESARKLAALLCSPKDPKSDVPISDLYNAKCSDGMGGGPVREFSRPVAIKVADLVNSLRNAGIQDGRKAVKFDALLVSIDRAKAGFLVSVRFDNTGDYPIKFKTPDKWDAEIGRNMDILGVNGYRIGSRDSKFGLGLAGKSLENSGEFPDGEVSLAPHSSVTFKIKTTSVSKFAAGSYDLNVGVFMNIEVPGIQSSLVRVDFHSDHKNPTRVTFDRDYPSTPQEREQWEAYQRTRLSHFPINPGETFAEDGLYRAVRLNSGGSYRSLQVMPFKAGDIATTDSVKMPMESGDGVHLDGPVQWVWEGSAPTPTKPFSSAYVEGTEQFSLPGAACPRGGRWVARVRANADYSTPEYRYDLSRIVTMRRGQPMPSISNDA